MIDDSSKVKKFFAHIRCGLLSGIAGLQGGEGRMATLPRQAKMRLARHAQPKILRLKRA
jgi:hypothetical protein